jgi:hypothetical protein
MGRRQFSSEAEVESAAGKFLDCSLARSEWTHAAHFAVTLWLMRYRPTLDLSKAMPGLIRAFNESVGTANSDSGGYHETITQASLAATRHRFDSAAGDGLVEILEALLASPLGNPDWLLEYWSRGRLFSVAARRAWLAPDLKPLPYRLPFQN